MHEALARRVHQPRALAAQRLGEQESRHAGKTQRRGMKLVKLHVGQLSARSERRRDSVSRRHRRIGRVAVHLTRAAAGQQHRPRLHRTDLAILIEQPGSADAPLRMQQVSEQRPWQQRNARRRGCARKQRPPNLPAGGIAIRMQNAVAAVRAFARQHQLARMLTRCVTVKVRVPLAAALSRARDLLPPARARQSDPPAHRPRQVCLPCAARRPLRR